VRKGKHRFYIDRENETEMKERERERERKRKKERRREGGERDWTEVISHFLGFTIFVTSVLSPFPREKNQLFLVEAKKLKA
jgi:hypothetical protein